jgi:uncharacterized protein YhaN
MTGVKLVDLKINHYGELGDRELEFSPGLNPYYGRNESGKTLLVEAMTKMILDDRSIFQDLDRVENDPNGILRIERDGKEVDAGQAGLNEIFGEATPEDIRNAFIIRDFDLRLPERKNDFGTGGYFSSVTDRILGSKTQKIQALREEISDLGYLTNSTMEKNPGLKNTKGTGNLGDRKKDAEKLIRDIEDFGGEDILEKYSELSGLKEKIDSLERKERELEEAKKQRKYEKGLDLIQGLQEAIQREDELAEEENRIERLEDLREDIINAKNMDKPVKGLDREITLASLIATVVLAGSALLNPLTALGAAVTALIAFHYGKSYRSFQKKSQERQGEVEKVLNRLKAEDLDIDNLEEAEKRITELREDLNERKEDNLKEKQRKESRLEERFGKTGEDLKEWRNVVESFSEEFEENDLSYSEEKEAEVSKRKEEIEKEKENLERELKKYSEQILDFGKRFQKMLIQKFTDHDEMEIETADDLPEARRQLEEFVEQLEETVEASRQAIEILEEMESEEEDEFNKLFNEDSYAVEMFSEATDGRYTDINYDKASGTLKVEKKTGEVIEPQKLSQGTYDLLYMSIRLGLAKEILNEPGFLILDNAFVHSDIERVEKEIEFLKELEEEGWQIIYFTFRDDVKELIEKYSTVKELERL